MSIDPSGTPAREEGALAGYLNAIRAHRLLFAAIALASVAASVAVLVIRAPQYEATAHILVEPVPPDDPTFVGLPVIKSDPGDPARTIQTAVSLVDSQAAADLAAKRLGDPWTGERVLEHTEVDPLGDSNVVLITATADDSRQAVELADTFVSSALTVRADELDLVGRTRIEQLQGKLDALPATDQGARTEFASRLDQIQFALQLGDPTLTVSQQAVAEESATGPPGVLVLILAAIAGLVLGSGTAVLLELTTRRLRDEDEALRLYPLQVLARVPILPQRARRGPAGSRWFMPPGVREPFRTLAVLLEQRSSEGGVVMVTSPSSGDGKTTSAINLAVTLAATGRRVVILDLDLRNPQLGNSLKIDGPPLSALVDPKRDIADLLVYPSELRTLRALPVRADPDLAHLSDAALWRLPDIVRQAGEIADYVIIDTPPLGEVSDALTVASLADDLLVVVRPGNTHRSTLKMLRELLDRSRLAPEGYIVIGGGERAGRGYYGYGSGGAVDLVVGPAPSSERRQSESDTIRAVETN